MSARRQRPNGPLWALSLGFRGCCAPSDAAKEVVVHESTTGESNPNASSWKGDAAPAVGVLCKCAESVRKWVKSAMDDMWDTMIVPVTPKSFLGLRSLCRRPARLPDRQVVLLASCDRHDKFNASTGWSDLFSLKARRKLRVGRGRLDQIEVDAGKVCVGLRRVSMFNVNAAVLQRLSSTIAPATACSFAGLEVALRGNLWEDRDQWRTLHAHAPPWHVAPVREIARRSSAQRRLGILQ